MGKGSSATGERSGMDYLALLVAMGVMVVPLVAALNWIADDSCLDAGGRVLRGGADRLCQYADGRVAPAPFNMTATAWIGAAVAWVAGGVALYRAVGLIARRR